MKIQHKIGLLWVLGMAVIGATPAFAAAPSAESANGKYTGLLQELHCPSDSAQYGNFKDYGYWGGGAWCGQTGSAGYWVWVNPTWYVWRSEGSSVSALASANGTYSGLLQTLHCPSDSAQYGQFKDYGYWGGGAWCGQTGVAGYWVWANPDWYVWRVKR